jgi:hypothetical protein
LVNAVIILRRIDCLLLASVIAAGACGGGASAGKTGALAPGLRPEAAAVAAAPLRRLTQEQYRRSVRDLLGLKDPELDLPIDEGAGGFYGNTIAPVSELHLDKYGRAAELLARQAAARLPSLLPCDPKKVGEDRCAAAFIEGFGRRAFRRPLTQEELAGYRTVYTAGRKRSDFAGGIRLAVQAFLQSPHFLYLLEPAPVARKGVAAPVAPYALASRLSYFLWGTTPDGALLEAAAAGALATPEQVAAQARRMMGDPRFADTLTSFHLQWLDVVELPGKEKRNKIYPLFNEKLRDAMREETVRFVDEVVRRGDGRLDTLLTARFSVVGGPLFELYGLGAKSGAEAAFRRVEFDPKQRAGILTQASVMAVHSHWDKSSLVLRGKLIRERLLCTTLPPPPPDVNNTLPQADPKVSARERFEEHRSDVSCARCHRLIDPLGAPFEMYDGIGAYRTKDGPQPVDPEGELRGTARSDGPVKDAVELADRLAAAEEVRSCVARQWFRYALGRDEEGEDAASLQTASRAFRESGYRIPPLLLAIATSDAFRFQKVSP